MKKMLGFAVIAILGLGTAVADDEAAAGTDELEESKSSFKETWVHPDADFSKYDKIHLWDSTFEYRDVGPARRTRTTMMHTRKREFGISDADRQKFEEVVSSAFVKELQRGKSYEITEDIDDSTLLLRGSALDIISLVPPEMVGRSEVYLATIGEATLVLELLDSETGKVLAVVSERRKMEQRGGTIDQFTMPTNSVTVIAEVRRWAQRSASKLRKELDKAMK